MHEAMAQRHSQRAPSGTVIEVYQPGYRLGEHDHPSCARGRGRVAFGGEE